MDVAKPKHIELPSGDKVPILYEDRSVMAVDKPRGWLLAPSSWQGTGRNLQTALVASIQAADFWARSRNLKYLRFIHRLDAETTGVLLLAKSPGALKTFSALFESRRMEKLYVAAVEGSPARTDWSCHLRIGPDTEQPGRMRIDGSHGKEAETRFRVLQTIAGRALVEAVPVTGRTHQLRLHLAASGHPVIGDDLYGRNQETSGKNLGLRAASLAYVDPFTSCRVRIQAPIENFAREYGFEL